MTDMKMRNGPTAVDDTLLHEAFANLTPDQILQAVESLGYLCDGRLIPLNSYENRVYQVGLEDSQPLVVKFYRPNRWSNEAIQEEHEFTRTLALEELPVVAPIVDDQGETLHAWEQFRFSVYPRHGGRAPELDNPDHLEQLGRFIGRIHAIGSVKSYQHRPDLDIDSYAVQPRRFLLANDFIPPHLTEAYASLTKDLIGQIEACFESAGELRGIRLHGDCHPGNILWRDDGPLIVDFDDARMGPAVQDLWMFLSGSREEMNSGLADLLEGYSRFFDFNPTELRLVEALRTLRLIHYAAWIAHRWQDPAFPKAFPWFDSPRYWEEHILNLREQAALMNEPPLIWS
jgi:Ser/Thr protein kinase RdoA (MazF antagonist)